MAKKQVTLDEEFLQWWERGLEEKGYDLDEKQVRVLAHLGKNLYHVYSYREMFTAMRKGEYGPLLAYHAAYQRYTQSRLEALSENGAEIIPLPPKKQE
ncbi:MAG: hypothetical protein AABX31_04275 [Nanoarchaeota archaeon]